MLTTAACPPSLFRPPGIPAVPAYEMRKTPYLVFCTTTWVKTILGGLETGFLCVALAVLELTLDQTGLELRDLSTLCLLSAGIKVQHTQFTGTSLEFDFPLWIQQIQLKDFAESTLPFWGGGT